MWKANQWRAALLQVLHGSHTGVIPGRLGSNTEGMERRSESRSVRGGSPLKP